MPRHLTHLPGRCPFRPPHPRGVPRVNASVGPGGLGQSCRSGPDGNRPVCDRGPRRVASRHGVCGAAAGPRSASDPAPTPRPDLTDPHRWNEAAYGISLRPPEGWTAAPTPGDGDDFAWVGPDGSRIAFKIAYTKVPVQLDQASLHALVQMGFALDGPRLRRGEDQRKIGNRPGTVMLFDIDPPGGDKPSSFYAHAIVMLEPFAAAVIKVQSNPARADDAIARFEEVLASLDVPLGSELETHRRQQIELGVAWLAELPTGALENALPHEAWYRLSLNGEEVGHRRVIRISDPVVLAREPELRRRGFVPPGTAVVVQDHRERDGVALDRLQYAYTEADGEIEIWDLKQTLRPVSDLARAKTLEKGLPARVETQDDNEVNWVETGIRGPRGRPGTTAQNVLEVVQELPPSRRTIAGVRAQESFLGSTGVAARAKQDGSVAGRLHQQSWRTPESGYLGQIQALGLPATMPSVPGTAFAFYAWDPDSGDLALRTVRVGTDPDGEAGGYVVYERPAPSSGETRHRFAADGTYLETRVPGGVTITPPPAKPSPPPPPRSRRPDPGPLIPTLGPLTA